MQINYMGPYPLTKGTEEAAGYDICTTESATIYPGTSYKFKTGLHLAIPSGYVGLVEPRSGLSFKNSIENGAGVIDSDYRGEVRIHLYNHGQKPFKVTPGDRIAQMLIQAVESPDFILVGSLDETARGENGFGHTGIGKRLDWDMSEMAKTPNWDII